MTIYDQIYLWSLFYGFMLSYFKNNHRNKSHYFKIKNKINVDHLNKEIQSLGIDEDVNTIHIYKEKLSTTMQEYISNLSYEILEKIGRQFIYIPEITEIYYTAKTTQNSDNSFTNLHTDSPFHFCSTYRALVCIEACEDVTTIIPCDNIEVKLDKYDALAFDYANTLHYIRFNNAINKNRIVIKLHYAKTPVSYTLTRRYTRWARSLYINNLKKIKWTGYVMLYSQFLASHTTQVVSFGAFVFLLKQYYSLLLFEYIMMAYPVLALYYIGFQMYFVFYDF